MVATLAATTKLGTQRGVPHGQQSRTTETAAATQGQPHIQGQQHSGVIAQWGQQHSGDSNATAAAGTGTGTSGTVMGTRVS